ncbi:MAG: endonuclease III [Clostridia bacterium]|nr:endonuclease III [Clostridia bacterium]
MEERNKEILRLLAETYPDAAPELHFSNPYETLVAVMLSAQCTDKQVNKVTPAVFRDFPDVASMAATDAETLFPYVKSCGFKSKAANIVAACRLIMERFGGEVPRTMEELTSLPGVGRKTANVVMATAFGLPAIAVDTHVFRVSNRLGLAGADNVLDTEMQLREAIPEADWSRAHHWLIWHGRRVCAARNPKCEACPLNGVCRDYHMRTLPQKETRHESNPASL